MRWAPLSRDLVRVGIRMRARARVGVRAGVRVRARVGRDGTTPVARCDPRPSTKAREAAAEECDARATWLGLGLGSGSGLGLGLGSGLGLGLVLGRYGHLRAHDRLEDLWPAWL